MSYMKSGVMLSLFLSLSLLLSACSSVQSVQCKPIQGTGVDHGADDARVELAERTVRSVERVAIKHEQNYKKCAAQLAGAQALLSTE